MCAITLESQLAYLLKMNICISYDLAISLKSIYATEVNAFVYLKTCIRTSIAVLFIIAKTGNRKRFTNSRMNKQNMV